MMCRLIMICPLMFMGAQAANLVISGQDNQTYESGTWDRLIISNSSNITVRNLDFITPSGTDVPARISGSDNITVENCDIDGNTDACCGLEISGGCSYVTIRGCTIHDCADDGVEISGSNIHFYDNTVHDLKACGTDNGCGPCYNGHSDGFELSDLHDSEFRGNLVYNVNSTSAFFMGDWGAPNCTNLLVENNIFYTPNCGFVIYVHYVDGIRIYNNIFWKGIYGGLAVGSGVTGMDCCNNITQNINFAHAGVTPNPAQHRMDYNFVGVINEGVDLQEHDVHFPNPVFKRIPHAYSSTAYTDVTREDFELQDGSLAIDAGTALDDASVTDIYGNARDGVMDIGPFAVTSSAVHTDRPAGSAPTLRDRTLVLTDVPHTAYAVCIYDSSGNRIVDMECPAGAGSVDIPRLATGVYYVRVEGGGIGLFDRLLMID